MQFIGPVTFDEVRTRFRRDHPLERTHEGHTNQDADSALQLADEVFGTWSQVRLSPTEVRAVMLPWHLSEQGGLELVPRSGRTVGQVADLLRLRMAEFAAANPVCTAKLTRFRTSAISPVYLSTRPLPHDHYAGLPTDNGVYHLDGLHRLIAWELAGRLGADDGLTAFIAGDLAPDSLGGIAVGGHA